MRLVEKLSNLQNELKTCEEKQNFLAAFFCESQEHFPLCLTTKKMCHHHLKTQNSLTDGGKKVVLIVLFHPLEGSKKCPHDVGDHDGDGLTKSVNEHGRAGQLLPP